MVSRTSYNIVMDTNLLPQYKHKILLFSPGNFRKFKLIFIIFK